MRLSPVLIIFLIVVSVYILPQVVARFSGSHTMEVNTTGGASNLRCTGCHQYTLDELNGTKGAAVFLAHENAAKNTTYTQNWLNMTINETSENDRVCYLCHLPQVPVGGSHTQIVIRACTDLDCHGTNESTNNTAYPVAGNVSGVLGSKNVHEDWFNGMTGYISTYQNETGANYTKDFWACLACHTDVEVNINATEEAYPHDNASASARRYF